MNVRREKSDSSASSASLRELYEDQAYSLYPWIEELRPEYRENQYDYDFTNIEEKHVLTYDNDGGILAMTPLKWIESLTSETEAFTSSYTYIFINISCIYGTFGLLKHLIHRFFYSVKLLRDGLGMEKQRRKLEIKNRKKLQILYV